MAQATQQIYTDNPGNIPASFSLPAGLDLVIQSIVARWNGAAAAGSFKPCLSVYSQDDRLVGRFFPDTDLDTGDTAVVTYAPFLRGAPRGTDAASMTAAWGRIATTIADNTVTTIIVGAPPFDVNHRFEFYGNVILPADADASAWTLAEAGGYAVWLAAFWETFTGDRYLEIASSIVGDIQGRQPSVRDRRQAAPDGNRHEVSRLIYARDAGNVDANGDFIGPDWLGLSDSTVEFKCFQNSGAARSVDLAYTILQTTKFLPNAI